MPIYTWPGVGVPGMTPLDPVKTRIEHGSESRTRLICYSVDIAEIHIALSSVFIFEGVRPLASEGIAT